MDIPRLGPRDSASHKGTFGRLLLIGGSRGLSGSIALSGMAAVNTGAGLVKIATADCCLETVAAYSPCYMTVPLECDDQGRLASLNSPVGTSVPELLQESNCVAIGPGLGRSSKLQQFVSEVVAQAECPLIVDADGLNNLADAHELLGLAKLFETKQVVLTPHPGEWARLSGVPAGDRDGQIAAAVQFAKQSRAVVVLKGPGTLITDGENQVFNSTGTPAMATGGSGDVLTGVVAAAVCQGLPILDAARFAVHVHGLAGEVAEEETGHFVVPPTTLIDYLPKAISGL